MSPPPKQNTTTQKTIEFETRDAYGPGEHSPYISIASPETTYENPDEVVITQNDITVEFSYPLSKAVTFDFHSNNGNGFTREQLEDLVTSTYQKIYEEEEESTQVEPGHIPGMLNRNTTNGKYGIWGHDIEDLVLHTLYVTYRDNALPYITLGVDS